MRVKATGLAALVTIPALLLATACSSDSSGSGDKKKDQGQESADEAAKPAAATGTTLTKAQLDKAVLAKGDLAGFAVAASPSKTDENPKVDSPQCQPIIDVMAEKASPKVKDAVNRGLSSKATPGIGYADVLRSYTAEDAQQTVADLKNALVGCASGFGAVSQGQKVKYSDVKQIQLAKAGDESVGFQLTGEGGGQKIPLNYVVVREGATLAMFIGMDLGAKKPVKVPQELVNKQVEKIAAVSG
ncbi:hypothetical protein [Streptomyces sp. H27-D2]|uniref:hypothetical protein n=1 Tax=Streptomyces sp. H27-D2 TaxID=3046304 RepID=UPI002DBFEED4|nr:hypothetical protein [Streptomyces sp. H27-D2]MEC4019524.1 hypothetical protein [Streptomyces sp. H27-D2]